MKLQELSIRKFLLLEIIGVTLTVALSLLTLYLLTGNSTLVYCGAFLTAALFAWGVFFLKYFQKKLSEFINRLCQTIDGMIDGSERPEG